MFKSSGFNCEDKIVGNHITKLKNISYWLFIFIGIAGLISNYFGEISERIDPPASTDFYKFYLSSSNLLNQQPVYWFAPDRLLPNSHCNPGSHVKLSDLDQKIVQAMPEAIRSCLHPNLNPPLFVALITPLGLLDYSIALWIWSLISIIAGISALCLIFNSDASPTTSTTIKMFIGLGFFAYYPTFANSAFGQVSLFLLLDITLAWLAMRKGQNIKAGCWLGIAASIKPFFGLFLIACLVSKNWRASSAFIAIYGVGFLLGGLLVGFSAYSDYFAILNKVDWLSANWNGAFTGFFSRMFDLNSPLLGHRLSVICSLVTAGGLIAIVIKQAKLNSQLSADCLMALTIPAMLLLSPLGWMYYFPMLFISFVVLWNLTAMHPNGRTFRLLLLFGIIPTLPPKPLILTIDVLNSPTAWLWDADVYFYLLLLTFLLNAFLAYQACNRNIP